MTALSTTIPLLVFSWILREITVDSPVVFMFVGFGAGMIGVIPGLFYIAARNNGRESRKVWISAGLGLGFVCYVAMALATFFSPFTSRVLYLSGIYDSRPHVYQLLNETLLPSVKAAAIPTSSTSMHVSGLETNATFIGAYLRFNFGGIKLLCRTGYDPDQHVGAAKAATGRSEGRDARHAFGDWCLPVKAEEVRVLRRGPLAATPP